MLGHRVGTVASNIIDGNPTLFAVVQIDIIHAGCQNTDVAAARSLF